MRKIDLTLIMLTFYCGDEMGSYWGPETGDLILTCISHMLDQYYNNKMYL